MDNIILYESPKIYKKLSLDIDIFMKYNYQILYNNIIKKILKDLEKDIKILNIIYLKNNQKGV